MRGVVWTLVAALIVLHQDFWWWDSIEPLVFGFLPIGMAYHAGISIVSAVVWALAVKYCWPKDVDVAELQWAAESAKHKEL